MSGLVFAILSTDKSSSTDYQLKLRELTLAWTKYRHQGEVIEGDNVDSIMSQAAEKNASFCLIQKIGHIIDERWYLPHWEQSGFYESIDTQMLNLDFLVSAEWEFKALENQVDLQSDCMLVNVEKFIEMGRPVFTSAATAPTVIDCDFKEGVLSNHGGQLQSVELGHGGNWIKESLEHGLVVNELGPNINHCRFYLAKSSDSEKVLSNAIGKPIKPMAVNLDSNAPHEQFIKKISNQIIKAKNGVFLFNIESYIDLESDKKQEPLDALFSVAAGFKPYRILLEKGFTADTEVIFYDYSQTALDVKKYIIDNWDGVDFPKFIRVLFKEFPHPDAFYQLWDSTTPLNLDWNDMEIMWQNELEKWGGQDSFAEHWAQCKSLTHSYIKCDLLQDRASLLKKMSQFKSSYIWWSNAFFTIFSHWHFNASERKQQYLEWVESISQTAPECEISGADHNNSAVNGLTAKEYSALLDKTVCDQLRPQQFHNKHMQF
jgi:hypothetical protein